MGCGIDWRSGSVGGSFAGLKSSLTAKNAKDAKKSFNRRGRGEMPQKTPREL